MNRSFIADYLLINVTISKTDKDISNRIHIYLYKHVNITIRRKLVTLERIRRVSDYFEYLLVSFDNTRTSTTNHKTLYSVLHRLFFVLHRLFFVTYKLLIRIEYFKAIFIRHIFTNLKYVQVVILLWQNSYVAAAANYI